MPEKKYMTIKDVQFKHPLSEVKPAKTKNDTLIIPENFLNTIGIILLANDIEHTVIEEPALYPKAELDAGLKRYEDLEPIAFGREQPVLLITPFDADALFEWSKQLIGETKDPNYQKFLDDERKQADEYYRTQYEFRPD